jgi:hypothetical protein
MRHVGEETLPDSEVPTMNATQVAPQAKQSQDKSSCPAEPHHLSTQVRCFVYAVGPKCYRAECIDLDIAAEGTTEREARHGLRDAIVGYLSVTCEAQADALREATEKEFRKLILRPAPLTHHVHYYLGKVKLAAFSKRESHSQDQFYKVPAPCSC